VLGNALDMPSSHEWEKAAEWRTKYGDLVFVNVLGKPLLFLNSYEMAVELLERRATVYASRPHFVMANDLEDWNWIIALMPYGELWKRHRPYLQKFLQPPHVFQYMGIQFREAHKLCGRLLRSPEDFTQHVRSAAAGTIMDIAYGHEVSTDDDAFVKLAEDGVNAFSDATTPGKYMVEFLPWLNYLPDWFPGAGFKIVAREANALSRRVWLEAHEEAKRKFIDGTARPSLTSTMIEQNLQENGQILDEDVISRITSTSFAAGADTSVSTILSFMLAMTIHPEVQRKAHAELDRVVGSDRLPTFEDRSQLPYIEALCKECLRWQPAAPLGGPHATSSEDIYNGYYIPEGCWVLANQWCMLRDPVVYPEPHVFRPERFLESDKGPAAQRDPAKIAFGFGRRFCPGRHLAQNSIFMNICTLLATFEISKAIGLNGETIEPRVEYGTTVIRHPLPFKCSIKPRSKAASQLILQALESDQ